MEEREVLVKVEGLSKKFCKDLKTSLRYGVQDLFLNFLGNKNERELREKEFWAVKDINFELRRGECLGLIGHNGAGKSTLLKILNGLIKPDAGKVTIRGKVGALIELGAGFNPILTGRENIYNNGAVLGFTRKEIDEKAEEIIDFAEIREFIDMPVQNYSSGMKVRLGFAIAAQMKPDVLIIDEVLAVGDLGFVLKCFKTIDAILPETAIIFVSHSMPLISRISNKILLLKRGLTMNYGNDVAKGIDTYYHEFLNNDSKKIVDEGIVEVLIAEIVTNGSSEYLKWREDLRINLKFSFKKQIDLPLLRLIIYDLEQRPVAIIEDNLGDKGLKVIDGLLEFQVNHNDLQFSKGIYTIDIAIFKSFSNHAIYRINNAISFQIAHDKDVWPPFLLYADYKQLKLNKGTRTHV